MRSNDEAGVVIRQTRTAEERDGAARQYCSSNDLTIPVLVDSVDNRTAEDYSAFPDRLYLVDCRGQVAYKGGRGPFDFDLDSLELSLCLLLLEEQGRRF